MKIKIAIITPLLLFIWSCLLNAAAMNYGFGIYGGFYPSMGGSLDSYVQQEYLNSSNGIDGMNMKRSGETTSSIDHIVGAVAGIEFKAILFDYYLIRTAFNYSMGVSGGKGSTFYTPDNTNYYKMICEYTVFMYDIPLTVGILIPFWKDMKISLSCGVAYAYASYENEFSSSETTPAFKRKGNFKGRGLPLVIVAEAEYFITEKISIISVLSYYNGSTNLIKDSRDSDTDGLDVDSDGQPDGVVDYATIDFTGYRFSLGFSFYFYSI